MFYRSKNSRSSIRGGYFINAHQRPKSNGHFNYSRNFSSRRNHRSQLIGRDVNIFIKKAAENDSEQEYNPNNSFDDFALASVLKLNIAKKGYATPTQIQDQAIQPILEGRDLIGLANTGTGKTGAFLIPVINSLFRDRQKGALIIVPTRELAVQINEEFRSFAENMHIYSCLIIGGTNMNRQIMNLRRNPQVVIATPGRLKDLIQQRQLFLEAYSIVVLDEVDLMVDIGFINDVKYFISLLPAKRQSLFFSATISVKIQQVLLANFVKNPVTVSVKKQDTAENIDQNVIKVTSKDKKIDQLHDLLIQDGFDKVMVFGQTKHGIEKLSKDLAVRGFKVGAIHGNKKQGHRQRTLDSFKRNDIQVLLATDVASRGLDIENVTHVINYDLPSTYDDYIHRIGRTGRANKKGFALTFID